MSLLALDPAAEFLLDLSWPNMFDPTPLDHELRCIGCGALVKRWRAEQHFKQHVHRRDAERRRAKERADEQRRRNLEKARAARAREV